MVVGLVVWWSVGRWSVVLIKPALILAFTRKLCLYAKIKSAIIAKLRKAFPSFKYTDVLHGKTIGWEAFGTVKLGYIVSMQQKVVIKSFCDEYSNQHILAEGLVYSEMSGNINFPFLWHDWYRCLIIEYVSSSETLKKQLSEQNYLLNWIEVCLGIVEAIYSLHLKDIIHNDIHCNNILIRKC